MEKPRFKTLVINLERRPDRRAFMTEQLDKLGWTQFDFFAAVDGKTLVPNQEIQDLFAKNDFNSASGTIGCALSHYRIWQQLAADQENDFYIVMEDDVTIQTGLVSYIHDHCDEINSHPIVLFQHQQYNKVPGDPLDERKIVPLDRGNYVGGNMLFSINKHAAKVLLQYVAERGIHAGIDVVMAMSSPLRAMQLVPMLICPDIAQEGNKVDTDIQRGSTQLLIQNDQKKVFQAINDSFVFFPSLDQIGNDSYRIPHKSIQLLRAYNDYYCPGVNTLGYAKKEITKLSFSRFFSHNDGLFVKKQWVRDVASGSIQLASDSLWTRHNAISLLALLDNPQLCDFVRSQFTFVPSRDSHHGDIRRAFGTLDELLYACFLDPLAKAVNTLGYIKHSVGALQPLSHGGRCGIYIKKEPTRPAQE